MRWLGCHCMVPTPCNLCPARATGGVGTRLRSVGVTDNYKRWWVRSQPANSGGALEGKEGVVRPVQIKRGDVPRRRVGNCVVHGVSSAGLYKRKTRTPRPRLSPSNCVQNIFWKVKWCLVFVKQHFLPNFRHSGMALVGRRGIVPCCANWWAQTPPIGIIQVSIHLFPRLGYRLWLGQCGRLSPPLSGHPQHGPDACRCARHWEEEWCPPPPPPP